MDMSLDYTIDTQAPMHPVYGSAQGEFKSRRTTIISKYNNHDSASSFQAINEKMPRKPS